jgi:ABC-type dipeptide/oligopeptide/nickel transport system ATPase component
MPLMETRGLTVELPTPSGWVLLVNEVSLRIDAGESGSGKTMMALALMGLLPAGYASDSLHDWNVSLTPKILPLARTSSS